MTEAELTELERMYEESEHSWREDLYQETPRLFAALREAWAENKRLCAICNNNPTAVSEEREACARIAEKMHETDIAAAIRARTTT